MIAHLSLTLTQLAFSPWLAIFVAPATSGSAPALPIDPAKDPTGTTLPLQIVITLTLLTFIPAILVSMTCFTRLIIVFHFLRQAIGTQEVPNNQILISLALFLTLFVMAPVANQVNQDAVQPMIEKKIGYQEALTRALVPIRGFLFKHTRETDLALFVRLSHTPRPQKADDVPTTTLIPAFMISELKTAFQIGFVLFIPFLVIDLAVSSVLLSLGMMQVPPVLISTPLKLLLFVMVDGWYLIIGSLVKSLV